MKTPTCTDGLKNVDMRRVGDLYAATVTQGRTPPPQTFIEPIGPGLFMIYGGGMTLVTTQAGLNAMAAERAK